MFKKINIALVLLFGLLLFISKEVYAESSVREALINSKSVTSLTAIDESHSWVEPVTGSLSGSIETAFYNELWDVCNNNGGVIEAEDTKAPVIDPITGKAVENVDPITGVPVKNWMEVSKENFNSKVVGDSNIKAKFRCKNILDVVETYRSATRNKYGVDIGHIKSFLLKHNKPQPHVYKNTSLPATEKVVMLKDGDIHTALKGIIKTGGGLFGSLIGVTPEDKDVYQYLNTLCINGNGTPKSIIKKIIPYLDANGKKKSNYEKAEGNQLDTFKFVFEATPSAEKEWYYSCYGGTNKFVVRMYMEPYVYQTGETTYHSKGHFASNRGIEGVTFKTLEEQAALLSQATSQISIEIPATPPVSPDSGVKTADNIQDQIAIETAAKKITLLKTDGNQEYVGLYNNADKDGCNFVSIIKKWDTNVPSPRTDTYNYKVCNGSIAKYSETPADQLPDGIEFQISLLSKITQRTGTAASNYQGYNINGVAVRDKDYCSVEIKVLKDNNLYLYKIVNGCK